MTDSSIECTPQVRTGAQPLPDRVARLEADVARLKTLLRASSESDIDEKVEEPKIEDDEDLTLIDSVRLGKRTRRANGGGEIREDVALQMLVLRSSQTNSRFFRRASHYFPFLDGDFDTSTIVKTSLLYWAMVAVGSREADELSATYELARRRVVDLIAQTIFGQATKEDLQGVLIGYM